MPSEGWSIITKLPTVAEAEVIKLLLEVEGVEAEVQSVDPITPQSGVYLAVESDLIHRAIWILKNRGISDAELDFSATRELPRMELENDQTQ